MAELRLDGVVKRYGRTVALDGMSFEVGDGEFFCLLGPSSAGKTTTLRAIAGLEPLQAGSIAFAGREVTGAPVQGRGMAMIFQTFALYPHLSVRQNLAYPLARDGKARDEVRRRVDEVAELLRVGHTLERRPATLSGGEQQRVAIGRAIVRRPKLLLLDEPLTNLDAKLRHDMRTEFKRLHRELGMTMLYATPDQLEALTMAERVAVIRDGRVVQTAPPRDLYARPDSTYTAGMVGAPMMNLIQGRVRHAKGGATIELPFGALDAARWGDGLRAGDEVILGIRPHDVRLGSDPHALSLRAGVRLTEPLGDVTVLDLAARGAPLKMVLREEVASRLKEGGEVEVSFRPQDAHLFHKETGVRIG
ncbi:MAG: ABC transporter ATP-binding protein [Geminicoccaceae bacterium]|nr:ABC transporter ATP-binding protein [Geminicoccaceae bacterium]